MQKANQGDPLAQHELGARYLNGDGFEHDTIKSFFWINKAAQSGLPIALYNRAIFLTNGWGTEWNPFTAFNSFYEAAQKGFSQSKYVIGLLFTENLIVPKNLDSAYFFMRWAANDGFEPAIQLSEEIKKRIDKGEAVQSQNNAALQLNFIDFTADTISTISDSILIRELISSVKEDSLINSFPKNWNSIAQLNSSEQISLLENFAEYGNPEALTLLAVCYQLDLFVKKDFIKSIELLLRAYRLESFRAASLLNETLRDEKLIDKILKKSELGDPSSQYIIATLTALNLSGEIFETDVIQFYKNSSEKNFAPSKNELAGMLISGNISKQNFSEAMQLYNEAIALGNFEAASRKSLYQISTGQIPNVEFLFTSERRGAIISQLGLAYCFENGIGVTKNLGKAVTYYRSAAFRGSRIAYDALKKLYEDLRPADEIFQFGD